jgi:hypothetical protein
LGLLLKEGTFDASPEAVEASNIFPLCTGRLRREAVGKSPRDPKSVEITLRREGYRVELHDDCTVLYQGWRFVAFTGKHRGSIPKKTFQEILEQFLKINYESLSGEYGPYVRDTQAVETSLNIDGKSNSVRRWEGGDGDRNIRTALAKLEDGIDRLANTARWTNGNSETIGSLKEENWNFKSKEAANTLVRVALYGNAAAVRDLIAAGVSLNGRDEVQRWGLMIPSGFDAGNTALERAAFRGDIDMLHVLLDVGAGRGDPKLTDAAIAKAEKSKKLKAEILLRQYASGKHLHNVPQP